MNDQKLLMDYADRGSEHAFTELTRRYVRLVYATCRREVGDRDLADDVTQAVFLLLARKARSLSTRSTLAGWLFQTSVLASRNARRQEARRTAREQRIGEQMERVERDALTTGDPGMFLNSVLASLNAADREVILLRFMSEYTLRETGEALGISEDGARKRIDRALAKLQRGISAKDSAFTAAALTLLLESHRTEAIPEMMVRAVLEIGKSASGGAAASTSAHTITQGVIRTMIITKIKIAAFACLAIGAGIGGLHMVTARTYTHPRNGLEKLTTLPGSPVTDISGSQVAAKCVQAYKSVSSFQGSAQSTTNGFAASAVISFVAPNKLRVDGIDLGGQFKYALASNSDGTWVLNVGQWAEQPSEEMGIAACTGISGGTAENVPALLTGVAWGNPFAGRAILPRVNEVTLNGRTAYCIQSTTNATTYWIDRKTFFLVKLTDTLAGTDSHTETFSIPTVNAQIPASTFAKPAGAP